MRTRRGTVAVTGLLLTVAVLAAGLWLFQRQLLFFPTSEPLPPAGSVLRGAEDVVLTTADGLELTAWHVPASGPDSGYTVLVAHGNGGDVTGRAPLARALAGRGLSVLLLEYRGYGGNPGSPSEEGLALDARAGLDHLTEERDVPPERIVYLGESLGTAVVSELATEHPPAALVLRSPFEDLAALAQVHHPLVPEWFLRDELDVVAHISQVEAPTAVVYGAGDTIVPPRQSRRVADAAAGLVAEVVVPGAGHNDRVMLSGRQVVDAVTGAIEHADP